MGLKCYFQYEDKAFCKKWAQNGSRFCHNHQPPDAEATGSPVEDDYSRVRIPSRLATHEDLFELVSAVLHSTATGATPPAKAFAVSALVDRWLQAHSQMRLHLHLRLLDDQMLSMLVDPNAGPAPDDPVIHREAEVDEGQMAQTITSKKDQKSSLPVHDPWAAGRMAGKAPPASPQVDLKEAQARLEAMLAGKAG